MILAGIPANTEIIITEERDGVLPFAANFTSGTEDLDVGVRVRLGPLANDIQSAQTGVTIDNTKCQVRVSITQPTSGAPTPNATFALSPASGEGPFYAGADNVYDPTLTATTTGSPPTLFYNVDPGDIEVTVGPDTLGCTDFVPESPTWKYGWVSSKPNTTRLTSIAGYMVSTRFFCE